jgi:DNA-binding helix-hairpin-helix protein with protein kinase domain
VRSYQDLQGKEVVLGRCLGQGGEGAVYAVPLRPGLVAKIYARTPDEHTGGKLAAMGPTRHEGAHVAGGLAAEPSLR